MAFDNFAWAIFLFGEITGKERSTRENLVKMLIALERYQQKYALLDGSGMGGAAH